MKPGRMIVFWAITSILFSTAGLAAETRPVYTLDMLFQKALNLSENVKLSEESLYVAEQNKKRALSVLVPRFSAFGDYTRYSEEKFLAGIPIQPKWSSTYGLRIDQSFTLNGKELIALEMSKKAIKKERFTLNDSRETLLMGVASAYYQVLKAEKNMDIARANVDRLRTYKAAVQTRLKLGAVTKTDLFRASAELSGAVSDQIQAASGVKIAEAMLARLIGISTPIHLASPDLSRPNLPEFDLVQLKREAVRRRSDLKALELSRAMSEDEVRFTKSAWWPEIGIEGVWARQDASSEPFAPLRDSMWAKVSLGFSLFDGGLRRADLNQSLSRNRQATLGVSALKKQIAVEVDSAYYNYITRRSTITALTDQRVFARENYKAVTRQFEFGLANSVDVVDANTLLVTTERQWTEAILEGYLSRLKIERATGQLLDHVQTRLKISSSGQ